METGASVSKRSILSEISNFFDYLGLLGPIIVLAKLIIPELWQLNLYWDESIPPDIDFRWRRLKDQLHIIKQYSLPRCVKVQNRNMQLHGFCDASQRAYEACVYICSRTGNNQFRVELLRSKSRVAAMKAISLFRLQLSAAVLLVRLVAKISTAIDLSNVQTFLWSDSMITFNWISSPTRKWIIFIANKVSKIQRITDINSWQHISSANNLADLLSRGIEHRNLSNSTIWWHGPTFLASTKASQ